MNVIVERKRDVPFRVRVLVVQLWSTFLTVVLVWTLTLFNDAHTPTMLPDTAAIALDEEPTCVVTVRVDAAERFAERRSWVLLVAADAASDILIIASSFFGVVVIRYRRLFFRLRALAATRWLAWVFARQRMWCRRLCFTSGSLRAALLLARGKRRGRRVRRSRRGLRRWRRW